VASVNRNAGIEAAKIAGNSSEMDAVAARLVVLVKAEASKHNDSGAFSNSVAAVRARGKRGVTDRLVIATDPLAAVKEFGHVVRREKGGPALGYVPGQHSMGQALARLPAVSGD
jgi:hypothetical protein